MTPKSLYGELEKSTDPRGRVMLLLRSQGAQPSDFDSLLRRGAVPTVFGTFAALFQTPERRIAEALGVSTATFFRWKAQPRRPLGRDATDKLIELARVYSKAIEAFGSAERAAMWMVSSHVALGGDRPLELIFRSPLHRELVEETLGQIQFGLVS